MKAAALVVLLLVGGTGCTSLLQVSDGERTCSVQKSTSIDAEQLRAVTTVIPPLLLMQAEDGSVRQVQVQPPFDPNAMAGQAPPPPPPEETDDSKSKMSVRLTPNGCEAEVRL